MNAMLKGAGVAALLLTLSAACAQDPKPAPEKKAEEAKTVTTGPLSYKLTDIKGQEHDLAQYKGKVVVFVNVASKCGYTSQYAGLQELYEKNKDAGLVVIGVPANDFGRQEPGSNEEIAKFCQTNYNVTFPMMAKVAVTGDGKTPLYKCLTEKDTNAASPGEVKWNFEKFLVGRDGAIAARFKSGDDPAGDAVTAAVKTALAAPAK